MKVLFKNEKNIFFSPLSLEMLAITGRNIYQGR